MSSDSITVVMCFITDSLLDTLAVSALYCLSRLTASHCWALAVQTLGLSVLCSSFPFRHAISGGRHRAVKTTRAPRLRPAGILVILVNKPRLFHLRRLRLHIQEYYFQFSIRVAIIIVYRGEILPTLQSAPSSPFQPRLVNREHAV